MPDSSSSLGIRSCLLEWIPSSNSFITARASWFQANFSIWVTVVMSYSFTTQTLAQLDLLRYWFYGTARCDSGVVAPSCSLVLKRTYDQNLSSGSTLFTFMNNQLFQFRFAAAEQHVEMMDSTRIHLMSYTNRVREPTPSTHDRASCLLHCRQLPRHVPGSQQVAFQEDAQQPQFQ